MMQNSIKVSLAAAVACGVLAANAAGARNFVINGAEREMILPSGEHVLVCTKSTRLSVLGNGTAQLLVVGGGGGGGVAFGGGGGGGEVIERSDVAISAGTHDIVIGSGGAGATLVASYSDPDESGVVTTNWPAATAGGLSSAFGITARGGAGGGGCATKLELLSSRWKYTFDNAGQDGFSGGGGASCGAAGAAGKGSIALAGGGTNDGGAGYRKTSSPAYYSGGGGGGAGGAGLKYVPDPVTLPVGGAGVFSSVTGLSTEYGRGGVGGTNGVASVVNAKAESGLAGTGNGGNGARAQTSNSNWQSQLGANHAGGDGGSGLVVIRYTPRVNDSYPKMSGGVIAKVDGHFVHSFAEDGEFTVTGTEPIVVDVLLVAGGGGGGGFSGGGGGGGQVLEKHSVIVQPGVNSIVVGKGGSGALVKSVTDGNYRWAQNGGDSSAFGLLAVGGGAAGGNVSSVTTNYVEETDTVSYYTYAVDLPGHDGGSGGGCAAIGAPNSEFGKGLVDLGEGVTNDGAPSARKTNPSYAFGGGGGGAGGKGYSYVRGDDGATLCAPTGGVGVVSYISGSEKWYGGGGSGGSNFQVETPGGLGGGGYGARRSNLGLIGGDAEPGSGGGGGGGGQATTKSSQSTMLEAGYRGGNGADGVVIVRYRARTPGLILIFK